MAGLANLFGESEVYDKEGNLIDLAPYCAGKTVGIYFSAHWCPPCKKFTPVLAEFYNKHSESKNFDIIFVSSDGNEDEFNGYYNEMPWLYLDSLCDNFNVQGIPKLVLIDADSGDVVTLNGRDGLKNDLDGKNFPWAE